MVNIVVLILQEDHQEVITMITIQEDRQEDHQEVITMITIQEDHQEDRQEDHHEVIKVITIQEDRQEVIKTMMMATQPAIQVDLRVEDPQPTAIYQQV